MVIYQQYLTATKDELRSLHIFWAGFIIYSLAFAFTASSEASHNLFQGVQAIGVVLMLATVFSIIQFKIKSSYLRIFYRLYYFWIFIMILEGAGLLSDYTFLKTFLFNPDVGMLYFAPLIMLFPVNITSLKKIFGVITLLAIFYLIFNAVFIKDLLQGDHASNRNKGMVENFSILSFSSGFILLTYSYHTKKRQLLALFVTVLTIFWGILHARRGLIFMYSSMIIVAYILYISHSKKKLLIIYLTLFISVLGAIYITGIYKPHESRVFGYLVDRGKEDTRTDVEVYFYDDMKTKDWIIGRGINGKYFCPGIEENQLTNYRYLIETGYLQTILKGGLISLVLFLMIAIPAIVKGIFYSKNILSKAAGCWILLSEINSYPTIVASFSMQYLLVWISIAICYSKEIRYMPEKTIKNYLSITKE